MQELRFDRIKRILCVGAHSDDIEIGCGGTLRTLLRNHSGVEVRWVVFSAEGARSGEARRSAEAWLGPAVKRQIAVKSFKTSFFPYEGARVKAVFERLKAFKPDVVFTHYRDDRHQDHRVLSDLAWNTFRHHLVLEYEIPKYDGDLGIPNVFVPLDAQTARDKADHICRYFRTQGNKHWFSEDTFLSLMRLRGMECAADGGYAEAFYGRKVVVK